MESSQKTQYPPQFTFRIRDHCKSSVERVTTAVEVDQCSHVMFPVLNMPLEHVKYGFALRYSPCVTTDVLNRS